MSLIYSLITREDVTLVEYTQSTGNFAQIARQILRNVEKNIAMTIEYNQQYKFHYINENGITYLCLAESSCKIRTAFAFLEAIQKQFQKQYSFDQQQKAIAFSLQSFDRILADQMKYFNDNQNDKLFVIQREVGEVKNIMESSIKQLIDREEKIDLLVTKTQQLSSSSQSYKKQAEKVKRQAYWKNIRVKVFIFLTVLLIIYIIMVLGCSGFDLNGCF